MDPLNGQAGRPDPDAVLAKVTAREGARSKGRLKIFFGYSAGVGKTYAMLEAARALEMKRGDVLVGYVEPHGRPETESLLLGLDLVPFRETQYRGITLREFDLEETLRRRPRLVLVDELAHTNAEGSRHPKRWQDILELLDAGIDVFTTVNVQHLDSLNDVVAKITGVIVRETVPDTVFDRADDVELVDIPPEELLERLREGKVYVPQQAARAADRFFQLDTLVALRELALRRTAEHVNRQVELGRRGMATRPIWGTRQRLMVAVGPSPSSARLVRATRRMAAELRCPWFAVAVEPPGPTPPGVEVNLRLAERLGAEVVTLQGERVSPALIAFAHDRGVTRLVVGKTARPRWARIFRGDVVDEVVRLSGDIEVLILRGDGEPGDDAPGVDADVARLNGGPRGHALRDGLIVTAAMVAASTAGVLLRELGAGEANVVLVYLLAVALVAYAAGRIAAVSAAVLAVTLFNFIFTEPTMTLDVNDPGYLLTFAVMLFIGLIISGLVGRVQRQAGAALERANVNEILYRVSRRLGGTSGSRQVAEDVVRLADELLDLDAVVYLAHSDQPAIESAVGSAILADDERERAVAAWVLERGREAGRDTDTLPDVGGWYLPLQVPEGRRFGALGVRARHNRENSRERRRLVRSVAAVAAQAFEREELAERARQASVEAESERLRSDLLATVSHDLRTPLAAVGGAASAVLHSPGSSLAPGDRELLGDVTAEAERLGRLIENLLQLGRMDDGKFHPRAAWNPVEEIVGAAIRHASRSVDTSRIRTHLPDEPLLCWADAAVMTQVLVNLLENALKYAPEGPVEIAVAKSPGGVRFEVTDSGPGFPTQNPAELFGRFRRGDTDAVRAARGSGLGLAICRAAVSAHAGRIEATNREPAQGGGARVAVFIPDPADAEAPSSTAT